MRIWTFVILGLASLLPQLAHAQDTSVGRYRFRGVLPGISHYSRMAGAIDWLDTAGLLIKVPIVNTVRVPLGAYARENIFKLYLFDIGILGAMIIAHSLIDGPECQNTDHECP